jgi:2-hydroxychromene-2-carboxylate isomerase
VSASRFSSCAKKLSGKGAFGAPTFFVNGEMFWGNDRLDFVEDAFKRAA